MMINPMRSLTAHYTCNSLQLQTISKPEISSDTIPRICRISSCKCCKANSEDPRDKCHCFSWSAEKEHKEAERHQTVEDKSRYQQTYIDEERALNYWGRCCFWKDPADEIDLKQASPDEPDLSFKKDTTEMKKVRKNLPLEYFSDNLI
jgi:hypothetical protein